jgi:hypothetical protein
MIDEVLPNLDNFDNLKLFMFAGVGKHLTADRREVLFCAFPRPALLLERQILPHLAA